MTIKDIALYCGVSVSTVSRVLNKHPNVSEKAREKVLSILPVIVFCLTCQKHIIKGVAAGAVKG